MRLIRPVGPVWSASRPLWEELGESSVELVLLTGRDLVVVMVLLSKRFRDNPLIGLGQHGSSRSRLCDCLG